MLKFCCKMPKRYGRRRPYSRSRRLFRKKRSFRRARRKRSFRSGVNRTAGLLGIEKKFIDQSVSDTTPLVTVWAGAEFDPATSLNLAGVSQGDGPGQRDGRKMSVVSVAVKGEIFNNAIESGTGPSADQYARVIMVLDRQTNGAQLNAEDVMQTIGGNDDYRSFRNLEFLQRFKVLADKTIYYDVARSGMNEGAINLFAVGPIKKTFNFYYKFSKPLVVNYTGTTNAMANVRDNSIHLIVVGTSTAMTISYTSRCRFYG